jgi:hypothetical protein
VLTHVACIIFFLAIVLDFRNVAVPWSLEILSEPEYGRDSRVA